MTVDEINILIKACADTLFPARNKAMLLIGFRHGFRASELCCLKKNDISFEDKTIYIARKKRSISNVQFMKDDEIKSARAWLKEREEKFPGNANPELFLTQRGDPMNRLAFFQFMRMISKKAGLTVEAFPHMLRHACGYELVNKGVDLRLIQGLLGHQNIQETIRYTELNPSRFKGIWD